MKNLNIEELNIEEADELIKDLAEHLKKQSLQWQQMTFAAQIKKQMLWSEATFGGGFRPLAICDHISKELEEIKTEPLDLEEWADLLILGLDGAIRACRHVGYSDVPGAIQQAIIKKLEKNEQRDWPDFRNYGPDEGIEHIKETLPGLFPRGTIIRIGPYEFDLMRIDKVTEWNEFPCYEGRNAKGRTIGVRIHSAELASEEDIQFFRKCLEDYPRIL